MALTRKFLEALGLNENQVQAVVEEHAATTAAIKADWETKYNTAKAAADKLPGVQQELDDLKKDDYKTKFETERTAFGQYKTQVEGEKARAAKAEAVKAYYTSKRITGGNLAIAMRGTDLESIVLDESGKIKDSKVLDDLVSGDFKTLVDTGKRVVDSGGKLEENGGNGHINYDLRTAIREGYSRQQ